MSNAKLRKTKPFKQEFSGAKRPIFARSRGECEIRWNGRRLPLCAGNGREFHHRLPLTHPEANNPRYIAYACHSCHLILHNTAVNHLAHRQGWLLDWADPAQLWTSDLMEAVMADRDQPRVSRRQLGLPQIADVA